VLKSQWKITVSAECGRKIKKLKCILVLKKSRVSWRLFVEKSPQWPFSCVLWRKIPRAEATSIKQKSLEESSQLINQFF